MCLRFLTCMLALSAFSITVHPEVDPIAASSVYMPPDNTSDDVPHVAENNLSRPTVNNKEISADHLNISHPHLNEDVPSDSPKTRPESPVKSSESNLETPLNNDTMVGYDQRHDKVHGSSHYVSENREEPIRHYERQHHDDFGSNFMAETKSVGDLGKHFVSITVVVPPGAKHCYFYSPATHFEVTYQVLQGGNFDISVFVKDPTNEVIVSRPPLSESHVSVNVPHHYYGSPYGVCLDNRKSSYDYKHVYLSIDLNLDWRNPNEYERRIINSIYHKQYTDMKMQNATDEHIESVSRLVSLVDDLFLQLRRIEQMQQRWHNYDLIDSNLMDANIVRVTQGSIFQMVLMIGVAVLQVFLIRALFDDKSVLYRFWFGARVQNFGTRC